MARKLTPKKLLIARKARERGFYSLASFSDDSIASWDTDNGYDHADESINICSGEFHKIFPKIRLKKGAGQILVEVSMKKVRKLSSQQILKAQRRYFDHN